MCAGTGETSLKSQFVIDVSLSSVTLQCLSQVSLFRDLNCIDTVKATLSGSCGVNCLNAMVRVKISKVDLQICV